MKKVLLFSALLVAMVLTGCSGNKRYLDCNQSLTTGGYKQDVNLHAKFDGEDIVDYGIRYDMDLSAYSDTERLGINSQDMCSMAAASMGNYENAIINCKQRIENKHLVITADYNLKVLLSVADGKPTIESLKTQLEKQNYACIIK